MKHLVLLSAVVAALMVSGCSKKTPEVNSNSADALATLASKIQSEVNTVYFDFDKFNIKASEQSKISNNAALFNQAGAESLTVKIEGNCDEWGKRATAAKDALVKQGVAENRLSVVSYGESNLVCTDKTKACDAQNRRDEFKVGF